MTLLPITRFSAGLCGLLGTDRFGTGRFSTGRLRTSLVLAILAIFTCSPMVVAETQPGAFMGDLAWPELEQRFREAPLVVLPFGAGAKEHGPHLPMNADAVVMRELCERAIAELPILVAPPILHGWFPAFRSFPGTEVADPDVYREYVFAVAQSLVRSGAKRLVILNTGITMATGLPLGIVAREIRAQTGVPVLLVSWDDLEGPELEALLEQKRGGHADEGETSIHLYLQPDLVQMEKAVTDYGGEPKGYPGYRPGGFERDKSDPQFSLTGVYGDPTLATAEKGKKFIDGMTEKFLEALRGFAKEPLVRE